MSRHFDRAPLGALSCPHSHRDVMLRRVASPWQERALWITDYWNPPKTRRQHRRQRIVAVALAGVAAALLAQVGW